jgi:hypothetical protein
MSNYLALRRSATPALTVSTLLAKSITFQSTMISLGQSTNQTNNGNNGSFTTGWASTLTGLTSIKKVVLSPNGSVQTILQNSGSTMSTTITSLNSGITWAGSTMKGLPSSGALPYQTYGSTINAMTVPSITAITAAPSGTNQLAIASNDLVYSSANSGATFAPTGLGQNNNPFIYLPLDGSVTDVMGNTTATVTGSIAYVPGKVGTQSVNVANTAGSSGNTASNYIRYTVPSGMTSFTISGWFNSQTTVTTGYPTIVSMYSVGIYLILAPVANQPPQLFFAFPSGSGNGQNGIQTTCGIAMNTWYSFTIVYQIGTCSLYVNGALVGTGSSTGLGTFTGSTLGLGCYDNNTNQPFSGYICDFRLYNYAVTNPSGAALMNPIVGPIMPFVYVTFDGSTTTDLMGNSTTTATGSPGFVAGQVGSNALDLSTNTAGGTATKNISGTWAGTSNFTVSGWFNAQAIPASSVAMIFSAGTGATTAFQVHITTGGVLTIYSSAAYTTSTITTNTWYFFQVVYQSSGTCYVYLNGTQVTTFSGTTLSPIPTIFNIGTYTHTAAVGAFKGYIDDIRIYNGAFLPSQLNPVLYSPSHAIGSPNIYLPFENGSVLDVMGYSAISARGIMNFVPGIIGSSALNLANPAFGTAVNYLRGSWAGSPNFTVSFWFNAQALGVQQQVIFSAYAGNYVIYLNPSNQIVIYLPSGGTSLNAITGPVISINTWYYVTATFQTNGSCALYVNNSLIGTYTNSGGVGSYTTVAFAIATYDINTNSAFSGYIDDFKLYNCAVPFNALGPMNYTQAYLSNTGAYQVVAAANGGVYTSANSGSSWSQAATSPQVAAAVNTVGGQLITPNLTSLAANTWTQNGVNWVASASSVFSVLYAYGAFNNYVGSAGTYSWGSLNNTYSASSPFACTSGVSTTILGIGATVGEWLQIQTSVPLVIQSYSYTCGGAVNIPQRYYIVGSNDGSAWYPIQFVVMTTNPFTANFQVASTYITVNQSGTQTITGAQTGSGSFTTYTTTTNTYTYFRFLATNVFGNGTLFEFGELYINFAMPPTPLYVAPSTALIGSVNAITVMPQQTGLASANWTANGISWVASASTTLTTNFPYLAFNNTTGTSTFYTGLFYNGNTGAYTGSLSTAISGLSAATGEWLQIQSSVPLVMSSYTFACTGWWQLAKTGFIVGSTDGTTWFPIQSFTMTTNPFFMANYLTASNYITIGPTGTQTQAVYGNQAGSGSFTGYATSSNAYTYFRFIASTIFGASTSPNVANNDNFGPSEWFINFTAYSPSLLQALTMSPAGAHMALTGAGATAPNLTGVAANTWTANGVTWTSAASSAANGNTYLSYYAFNNALTAPDWACVNSGSYTSATPGVAFGTAPTVTNITGLPSGTSVQGEWLQLQSSAPLIMNSYVCASGGTASYAPRTYFILGSMDGTNWFNLQSVSLSTNPTTSNFSTYSPAILVNSTSAQTIVGQVSAIATTTSTAYSANAYTYFRIIITTVFTGPTVELGEWYINFQSAPTFYSTDYGSSWTRSLSASTIPNANVLATSGGGQYSLQACGQTVTVVSNTFAGYSSGSYTTPTFNPALTATAGPVSNAAVSATGQYMVVLIQSTTNNVYYSTNYGVSFTGITLGSSTMVSCAISADGSYMTVANQTQVFTLNRNTQGFTVSLGNSAGAVNQGQNAIAIGNQAGVMNQSAGSIILNGSGSAVNSYVPGFFVSPIASTGSSVSGSFAVLGYGMDSQVVQSSSLFIGANGNMGFGTMSPQAALHIQGDTLFTNPTIYNTAVAGWYIIGYWDCTAAQNAGAHLKLRIMGCNGYNNSADTNQIGGETTIYLNNLNNLNTTTIANMDGFWKSEGGRPVITQATAVQGGSRYQYYIYANVQSYTQHSITAETTQGTIWTSQFISTTNPGANSLTVKVLTFSSAAVGANVGIGTTSPAYPLHVIGNINLTGSILYNGTAITTGTGSIWTAGSGGVAYYNGGSVAIGTVSPLSRFTIRCPYSDGQAGGLCIDSTDGSTYNMRLSSFVQGSGQVGYQFGVNNLSASYPNTLVLGYNGNVGIGMTLPAYSFDVNGTIQGQTAFQSSASTNNGGMGFLQTVYLGQYGAAAPRGTSVRIGDIAGAAYYISTGSYNLSFYKDVSGGNAVPALQIVGLNATNATPNINIQNSLGIGTTAPVALLHLYGGSYSSSTITNVSNFNSTASIILQVASAAANSTIFMGCNNMGGGGGAGIAMWRGGSYDTYLQVYTCVSNAGVMGAVSAGPYVANGAASWTNASDMRLKEDWQEIDGVLDKLLALTTGTFQWKNRSDKARSYGLIAQEVQVHFPEMISTDSQGYLGIQYTEMVPVAVKAIQVLTNQVCDLKSQVASLSASHASLLAWAQSQGFSS